VTLEEIQDVDDFINKLDRLELPNQVIAVVNDPLLQKYLALKPSKIGTARVERWLEGFFDDELHQQQDPNSDGERLTEVLKKLLNFTRYMKGCHKST
jgi:centromere protein I